MQQNPANETCAFCGLEATRMVKGYIGYTWVCEYHEGVLEDQLVLSAREADL